MEVAIQMGKTMNDNMRSEAIDKCGCRLERTGNGLQMVDCPLHKAALDLLVACQAAFERLTDNDMIERGSYELTIILEAAIAKATTAGGDGKHD